MRIYLILLFLVNPAAHALPTAKITIKVVDEHHNPVAGAEAGINFESPKSSGWGVVINRMSGTTDIEGLVTKSSVTTPSVGYSATKNGYYGTAGRFDGFTDTSGIYGFRKYVPWDPTIKLVLKRIKKPIPMYAVNMSAGHREDYPTMPVIGKFAGYDLSTNDWVAPYGKGKYSDFLFKIDIQRAVSAQDYEVTLTIRFTNHGDGLIEYTPDTRFGKSVLRFPHHAPESGYTGELVQRYKYTPGEIKSGKSGYPEHETNYFFRVRSELESDGEITGGSYGKIHGPISLGNPGWLHVEKPYLKFNYYFNPNNNDTNIEYNPEKNLFADIPERRKVSAP